MQNVGVFVACCRINHRRRAHSSFRVFFLSSCLNSCFFFLSLTSVGFGAVVWSNDVRCGRCQSWVIDIHFQITRFSFRINRVYDDRAVSGMTALMGLCDAETCARHVTTLAELAWFVSVFCFSNLLLLFVTLFLLSKNSNSKPISFIAFFNKMSCGWNVADPIDWRQRASIVAQLPVRRHPITFHRYIESQQTDNRNMRHWCRQRLLRFALRRFARDCSPIRSTGQPTSRFRFILIVQTPICSVRRVAAIGVGAILELIEPLSA